MLTYVEQELVISKYEAFFSQLLQDTSGVNSSTGSMSYRDVWDVEKFIGWSNETFDVGRGILGGNIHEEGETEGLGIAMNGEENDGYTDDEGVGALQGTI